VLERAFDGDLNFSEETKRFIDRHVSPGEKRPAAPSVRRGVGERRDQSGDAKGARVTLARPRIGPDGPHFVSTVR
jgi:hypothetical protein